MLDHNITPNYLSNKDESKYTNFNITTPASSFVKDAIGVEEIQNEGAQLFEQSVEIHASKINRFPVEVFPIPIQEVISATNKNLNFPIDFIGASLLYAVSVAVGNTYCVEVKKGFQQSAVLYLAIVARAGTNKSHPLSFAIQPIVEHDKRTYRQYEQERQNCKCPLFRTGLDSTFQF
jgi:hypothetical protein